MSYFSELQINSGIVQPVGSTLYGVCNSNATASVKVVTLPSFDYLVNGITIHVKFTYGNTAALNSAFKLRVGSVEEKPILNPGGNTSWSAGAVISFTYDANDSAWIVNDSDSLHSDSSATIEASNVYNPNSTEAISGQGVAQALGTLGEASRKDVITNIIETGNEANKNSDNLPTTGAVTAYVDEKTSNIKDAMHYRGITTSNVTNGATFRTIIIGNRTYEAQPGDVILVTGTNQEYIWVESNTTTHAGSWILLGDEGSYALNSSTDDVVDSITFNAGTPTEITLKNQATTVINSAANARAASAVVEHGILKITTGILPTYTTSQIYEIDSITPGTAPTLTPHTKQVIVPYE